MAATKLGNQNEISPLSTFRMIRSTQSSFLILVLLALLHWTRTYQKTILQLYSTSKKDTELGESVPYSRFGTSLSTTRNTFSLTSLDRSDQLSPTLLKIKQTYEARLHFLHRNEIKYYIYDDPVIEQEQFAKNATEDATTEVAILQALRSHPWRTKDPDKAQLFVIPLPTHALCQRSARPKIRQALEVLVNQTIFQRHQGNRHILIALEGRFFDDSAKGKAIKTLHSFARPLQNVTIVRNHDVLASVQLAATSSDPEKELGDWKGLLQSIHPILQKYVSVGILAGPAVPYQPISYESFLKRSKTLFFQTRPEKMARGSTPYRIALLGDYKEPKDNTTRFTGRFKWPFEVSLGWGLPPSEFWKTLLDAQFCLVIRGDTPNSHALFRAVSVGCLPIVVCDFYPVYSPTLSQSLSLKDFSIFVEEAKFLEDPQGSILAEIQRLLNEPTHQTLQAKILALEYAQHVALIPKKDKSATDRSSSLFVPALLREVNAKETTLKNEIRP